MTETQKLIGEIDDFLAETRMAESYFGQKAVRDSKLMKRLRNGGSVTLETATQIRIFLKEAPRPHKDIPAEAVG